MSHLSPLQIYSNLSKSQTRLTYQQLLKKTYENYKLLKQGKGNKKVYRQSALELYNKVALVKNILQYNAIHYDELDMPAEADEAEEMAGIINAQLLERITQLINNKGNPLKILEFLANKKEIFNRGAADAKDFSNDIINREKVHSIHETDDIDFHGSEQHDRKHAIPRRGFLKALGSIVGLGVVGGVGLSALDTLQNKPEVFPIKETPEQKNVRLARVEYEALLSNAIQSGKDGLKVTMNNLGLAYTGTKEEYQGKTVFQIVHDIAKKFKVEKSKIIGLIAAESLGKGRSYFAHQGQNAVATSESDVQGIMQVTRSTFDDTLRRKAHYSAYATSHLDHTDDYWSIFAGTLYYATLEPKYKHCSEKIAFAAADYNGGAPVYYLFSKDPNHIYKEVVQKLTPELLEKYNDYKDWSYAKRADKVTEIQNHGLRVFQYAQLLS